MRANKYIALASAIVITALSGGAASATVADVPTDSNHQTVSVTGVESGDSFVACKIIDIKKDSDTNQITYEWTSLVTGSGLTIPAMSDWQGYNYGTAKGSMPTSSNNVDTFAGQLANYIRTNNSSCTSMTTSGTTASATVSTAGSYLILPTASSKIYSAMIANINVDSNHDLVSTDAEIAAKVSNPGVVTKTPDGETYAIGETIPYVISATIPTYPYNAVNTKYEISDVAASNITIDTTSVVIKEGGASGTTLTVSNGNIQKGGQDIGTLTVTASGLTATFNGTAGLTSPIYITYNGSLGTATPAGVAQQNTATLTYPKDVYSADGSGNRNTTSDTGTVSTLGLKLIKSDGESSPTYLPGAEFEIYNNSDLAAAHKVTCYNTDTSSPATVSPIVTGSTTGSLTELGAGFCRGLAAGTYYVKETKAPTGYNLKTGYTTVTLAAATATAGVGNRTVVSTGYQEEIIDNNATTFGLPFTGGRGVVIYAIVGIGIVSIASVYYYRKKTSEVK